MMESEVLINIYSCYQKAIPFILLSGSQRVSKGNTENYISLQFRALSKNNNNI